MEKKKELTEYEKQSKDRINFLISEYCHGSQQNFSDRTGLNKASVSQYVNGKNTPSNITASKIADAFHVYPAWIMGFDVPMKPNVAMDDYPIDLVNRALEYYKRIDELPLSGKEELENYLLYLQAKYDLYRL